MCYRKKHILDLAETFASTTYRDETLSMSGASGPVDVYKTDQTDWGYRICQSTTEHWPSTLGDVLQLKKERKDNKKMLIYHLAVIDENSLVTDF